MSEETKMEKKEYKVKHHVATGAFSFMEIEAEGEMGKLVEQAKWLAGQFKDVQK